MSNLHCPRPSCPRSGSPLLQDGHHQHPTNSFNLSTVSPPSSSRDFNFLQDSHFPRTSIAHPAGPWGELRPHGDQDHLPLPRGGSADSHAPGPRAPASASLSPFPLPLGPSVLPTSPIPSSTSPTLVSQDGRLCLSLCPSASSALPGPLATWHHAQTTLPYRKEKGSVFLGSHCTAQANQASSLFHTCTQPLAKVAHPSTSAVGPATPHSRPHPRFPRLPFTAQGRGAEHLRDTCPPVRAFGRSHCNCPMDTGLNG